jgi:hypothetical protein
LGKVGPKDVEQGHARNTAKLLGRKKAAAAQTAPLRSTNFIA